MKKVESNKEPIVEKEEEHGVSNRRGFLKKAVYSAPVVLVLGQLVKPTKARADSGDPSGPPDWGGF